MGRSCSVSRAAAIGDPQNQILRRYIRLPGSVDEVVAMVDYTGSACVDGCWTYPQMDRIGSTLAVTDDDGLVDEAFAYSPYGLATTESGNNGFPTEQSTNQRAG